MQVLFLIPARESMEKCVERGCNPHQIPYLGWRECISLSLSPCYNHCNMGIIFNTRKTGEKSGVRGEVRECNNVVWVLFLILAWRGGVLWVILTFVCIISNAGIIFNTRKVVGGFVCGRDSTATVGVLLLIPTRRWGDLLGSEMFPQNTYLMWVLFLIPAWGWGTCIIVKFDFQAHHQQCGYYF